MAARAVDRELYIYIYNQINRINRIHQLNRINARYARSAIILARCTQAADLNEKQESDIRVIQTIKALYAVQDTKNRYPIVAEIFDSGLLGEHAVPSFRHALQNLCTEGARIIPKAAEVKGRLLHAPKSSSVNPIKEISGFDLSAFDQFRVPEEYVTQNLSEITHEFCSDEFKILDVDFEKLWPALGTNQCRRFDITILINSDKPIHGIAFWFTLFMNDHITLSSAPGRKDNHWGQAVSYFSQAIEAKTGQELKITVNYTDTNIWFEDLKLI